MIGSRNIALRRRSGPNSPPRQSSQPLPRRRETLSSADGRVEDRRMSPEQVDPES